MGNLSAKKHGTHVMSNYRGDIVAGSLLVPESRLIAQLFIEGHHDKDATWETAILGKNVLQKRSPETARRHARLIRKRLRLLAPEAWEAIANGSSEVATQFLFAACVKDSRLVGDFMDQIVRECHRTFQDKVTDKDWHRYLDFCREVDPSVVHWKPSTVKKIRQIIFRILAEARYIESTKSRKLLSVALAPEVRGYLVNHEEEYILRCMEVTQ